MNLLNLYHFLYNQEKKKETSEPLSSKDIFVATRKRKPDRVYKASYAKTFNAQKDVMELQVAVNIISQLKHLNPDLRVDPNMLGFNARSPGEASSAQQAVVQLINRLSTGSNNQGGAIEEREDGDCEDLDLT
uniref:Uncharacterized protein LOC104227565 isoform X1 n=2 Tax=Nicotiana sylvestris TaxID=4096 RepID=A0A1U7WV69_NICSY|nr:PREDICTED: uncharacterized protein LOC104227565 isoform X1 [Nicotiana sylvestris]XP_009778131.1 PREDICTED: uncharacterized protein LOC104227565 isoform X1 [Nicotiana sylvestris]XP_009778132.1 PREDICTED: uncharacterized protein LOC104227565 isoform X1 [Nicotiana sylvestris]XP_009778133.1 PREDICTED: uncharacterized protein LOC104227565 isoform X1 [Nicotiana sylvestris]